MGAGCVLGTPPRGMGCILGSHPEVGPMGRECIPGGGTWLTPGRLSFLGCSFRGR